MVGHPVEDRMGIRLVCRGMRETSVIEGHHVSRQSLMNELLQSVVDVQKLMAESQQKRNDRELMTRLKLDQKLKSITGETDYGLLEEIMEFELQMERTGVTTFREWCQCFERALDGKARNWTEEQLLFGPGQLYFYEAQRNEHLDHLWQRLCYFMRSQLLQGWCTI